jgi:hypothetical protein
MNLKSTSPRLVALAAVAALGLALGTAAHAGRIATQPTGDVSKAGGGCTVTSGSNKGKTGTYENDEGSLYCSGDGWSTGCVTSGGATQCKDTAKAISPVTSTWPIFPSKSLSFIAR